MMKYEKPVVELVSFQTEETMKSFDLTLSLEGVGELTAKASVVSYNGFL